MKLNRIFLGLFLGASLFAQEKLDINFKDLKVMDLIKITSKIIDKNILVTEEINGNVDFISNKPVDRDELLKILGYVLENKGYSLIQKDDILRIVKLNDSPNANVPVLNKNSINQPFSMMTEVFPVYNADVDYIASKVRHLISKNGKMVTNREANTLVITDFKDNIDTVKQVTGIMTVGAKKDISIVDLQNMKAVDAKKSLDAISKSLFNDKVESEKVSVIENKDNNSIVLVGKKENIRYLGKYLRNADSKGSLVRREVKVFPLKNVDAVNIIKILDSIIGKKAYLDPNDKPLASVDEESNAIVIMGPSNELEYVENLLNELDKEKAQVYVQARIIEVNDNLVEQIGLNYGILGGTVGSDGLAAISSNLNGSANNNALTLASTLKTALDITPENIKSGLALGASLNLLKQNGAVDIVSEPSILAVNNKESSIYVGKTISIKTTSSVTDGGTARDSFNREDVGLTLKVKPRISNDTKVTLEINTILEGVIETNDTNENPDTNKKEVKTTAILNNGESVIIGGLIENKQQETESKVPLLGDIPLIGELFKNKNTTNEKNNLVVIVTPYLVPQSKDITYIRENLAQLKTLEDRYLKDSLLRLKQKDLKEKVEDSQRQEKMEELDDELNSIIQKNVNGESQSKKSSTKNISKQQSEHDKRVSQILGN